MPDVQIEPEPPPNIGEDVKEIMAHLAETMEDTNIPPAVDINPQDGENENNDDILECLNQSCPEDMRNIIVCTHMDFIRKSYSDGWQDGWHGDDEVWNKNANNCAKMNKLQYECIEDTRKTNLEQESYINDNKIFETGPDIDNMYITQNTSLQPQEGDNEELIQVLRAQETILEDKKKMIPLTKIDLKDKESIISNTMKELNYAKEALDDEHKIEIAVLVNESFTTSINKSVADHSKLMDSGANRGLTRHKRLLRDFQHIDPIPVKGIGNNEIACHIKGYGYFDVRTREGEMMSFRMWWSPDCSGTVVSPNSAVTESEGRFTGWCQTAHLDEGSSTMTFFHRKQEKLHL